MSCFDSVIYDCPCGGEVEWQSKADECSMRRFRINEAPPPIAGSIDGEWAQCDKCGKSYTARVQCMVMVQ
jgi:hypothetical protein